MNVVIPQRLAQVSREERAEMMTGTLVRTSHRDYSLEKHSGAGGRVLVIRGGFEYGWASSYAEAHLAIDEMIERATQKTPAPSLYSPSIKNKDPMKPIDVIRELVHLQDAFNRKVNPNWLNAGYPFHRAIWMEGAEFVEGTNGWKWWKAPGKYDQRQLQLEVIDKLHFLISWALVQEDRRIEPPGFAAEVIGAALVAHAEQPAERFDVNNAIDAVENLVAAAAGRDLIHSIERFALLVPICQLSVGDLRRMYIAKNALNTVRNLNGYKEGTYQKTWNGEEDNVHLDRLMDEQPSLGFQDLVDTLTARYKALHA